MTCLEHPNCNVAVFILPKPLSNAVSQIGYTMKALKETSNNSITRFSEVLQTAHNEFDPSPDITFSVVWVPDLSSTIDPGLLDSKRLAHGGAFVIKANRPLNEGEMAIQCSRIRAIGEIMSPTPDMESGGTESDSSNEIKSFIEEELVRVFIGASEKILHGFFFAVFFDTSPFLEPFRVDIEKYIENSESTAKVNVCGNLAGHTATPCFISLNALSYEEGSSHLFPKNKIDVQIPTEKQLVDILNQWLSEGQVQLPVTVCEEEVTKKLEYKIEQ
ncbi:MAG: hypothetical protein K6L74_06785 [Neptuniibacter sp.]